MQNYPNTLLESELLGKENSWERFFCQPLGISLEEAYNGDNVILSSGDPINLRPNDGIDFFNNRNNALTEWRMLVKLGLLRIQPKLYEKIINLRQKIFAPNDRVLGVNLRGTDYVAYRPSLHPIQPPIEYAISKTIEKLNEWHCNKIFLVTEDKNYLKIFKQVFGDLCVIIDSDYLNFDPKERRNVYHTDKKMDYFLRGEEYLSKILIASTCNSLITGRTSGAVGIMMMANNFENVLAFNFGRYGTIGLN